MPQALQDIQFAGVTIPAGSAMLIATHTLRDATRPGVAFNTSLNSHVEIPEHIFRVDRHHCPGKSTVIRILKLGLLQLVRHFTWRVWPSRDEELVRSDVSGVPFPVPRDKVKLLSFKPWP